MKSTRRRTKAEVIAAPLRRFRSGSEKVEIINYARRHGLRHAAKSVKSPKDIGELVGQKEGLKKVAHMPTCPHEGWAPEDAPPGKALSVS